MEPKVPIIDFEREEVERGRNMPQSVKLLAGADLFDAACEMSKAGIRSQHPDFTEAQVLEELRRRIRLGENVRDRR
jgi:hypothetical protein